MQLIAATELAERLDYTGLIGALDAAFRDPPKAPLRGHHDIDETNPGGVTLLSMPAWRARDYIGVKLVNVVPDNAERDKPTILGSYVLMSATTGETLALLDAPELTARRTAAASALATDKLARQDARTHLIVGTGKLTPYMAAATRSVRGIEETIVWGRTFSKAEKVAASCKATAVSDLEAAVRNADIITCVTTTRDPIIKGHWLNDGAHLDLVGAFRPDMREVDDTAITRSRLFVDTFEGALTEAGELAIPLANKLIGREDIRADLTELITGQHSGRQSDGEITLFKSVGTAIEDYAAAKYAIEGR